VKYFVARIAGVLALVLAAGCAGTFEEARLAGIKARDAAPPTGSAKVRDDARCKELDDARVSAGANAKGLAAVAGVSGAGGGVSEAVIGAPRWVGITAAVVSILAGAGAVHQFFTAEGKSSSWVRECSP